MRIKDNNKRLFILFIMIVVIIIAGIVFFINTSGNSLRIKQHLDLGNKYLSELNYEQALAEYLAVIDIDPKNVDAYLGAADAYQFLGNIEAAKKILQSGYEQIDSPVLLDRINRINDIVLSANSTKSETAGQDTTDQSNDGRISDKGNTFDDKTEDFSFDDIYTDDFVDKLISKLEVKYNSANDINDKDREFQEGDKVVVTGVLHASDEGYTIEAGDDKFEFYSYIELDVPILIDGKRHTRLIYGDEIGVEKNPGSRRKFFGKIIKVISYYGNDTGFYELKLFNEYESDSGVIRQEDNIHIPNEFINILYDYYEADDGFSVGKFAFMDLNNDNIPELVLSPGNAHVHSALVYRIINGKVEEPVSAGTFGELLYFPYKGIIEFYYCGMGLETDIYYDLNDKSQTKSVLELSGGEMDPDIPDTYRVNNIEVSQKVYYANRIRFIEELGGNDVARLSRESMYDVKPDIIKMFE